MDRDTVAVYEHRAAEWVGRRRPTDGPAAEAFAESVVPGSWRADLGCGPGWHAEHLGGPLVALDAALSMAKLARARSPMAAVVQGDLEALPFRSGSLGGAWAHSSYLHVPAMRLPMALSDLHRALVIGAPIEVKVHTGERPAGWVDDFEGRLFASWTPEALSDVVTGAGFEVDDVSLTGGERSEWVRVGATRLRSLADTVGADMRLLLVGLNPSEIAADTGIAFARPGNRFWPAAQAAGVVTRDRDPRGALLVDRVGLTDLCKRPTPRAHWLTDEEYRAGVPRLVRLVEWLRPGVVCFTGLAGYRAAVAPRATVGWQNRDLGGRPVYVMPSPSGVNRNTSFDALVQHLRTAVAGPPPGLR